MNGNVVLSHVLGTLPDSFSQREALLADLLAIFPARNPQRASIGEIYAHLRNHVEAQKRIQLELNLNQKNH